MSEWLRLRTSHDPLTGQTAASINFKRWLPLGAAEAAHCDEYESPVGDQEAVTLLLAALRFTEMVTVDKQRQVWLLGAAEVAIDEVTGLGGFIEFEYRGPGDLGQADETISEAVKTGGRSRRAGPARLPVPAARPPAVTPHQPFALNGSPAPIAVSVSAM